MVIKGIKTIQINSRVNYPIVTSYEFEFLKKESEVQELLKPCTIYFIVQRPLMEFSNVSLDDGLISFEITDSNGNEPLHCSFDPRENGFVAEEQDLWVNLQFYKKKPDTTPPFNNVGAFKLYDENGGFIVWLTPQKFIYEYLTKRIKGKIVGDVNEYIDYHVHYIGQAFSQNIWDRLTGHEKMQRILTMEDTISDSANKNAFEISLLMLDITGYDEMNVAPFNSSFTEFLEDPIIHNLDEYSYADFMTKQPFEARSKELTNEVEAALISDFKPAYNNILFKKYPYIEAGTRSGGYSQSQLVIESLPASLTTEHFHLGVKLPV
ncbi:hypothetical protein HJ152_23240 [Vibrio parahaemolyticus]|nr:hypothetical protein [Vibrio parahaemolyticus]